MINSEVIAAKIITMIEITHLYQPLFSRTLSNKLELSLVYKMMQLSAWCNPLRSYLNPFPNNKFWTLPNSKSLQTTISNLIKMAESPP